MHKIVQINLQKTLGGGEVYTQSLCNILTNMGYSVDLLIHPQASFWNNIELPSTRVIPLNDKSFFSPDHHPNAFFTHTGIPTSLANKLKKIAPVAGFAHMPYYERDPRGLHDMDLVLSVSQHVFSSLQKHNMDNLYETPLLAIVNLSSRDTASTESIRKKLVIEPDNRKFRDRIVGKLEQLLHAVSDNKKHFYKKEGLTIGIVSRITPIKQFPKLFNYIAPILEKHPQIHLEIFGSGGYASVRDLKRALSPIRKQVRFWGMQPNPAQIYPQLDYILSGLPEQEALGLNLIESQSCGTPVLAVNAPPFTETVIDNETGYLYTDPRIDDGAHFERLITDIINNKKKRPDTLRANKHLGKFSENSFRKRLEDVLQALTS